MQLSKRLIELGYLPAGSERDVHDEVLVAAVQAFQADRALNPDGKVGGSTLAALNLTPPEEMAAIRATLAGMEEFRKTAPGSFVLVNLPAQQLMLVRDVTLDREQLRQATDLAFSSRGHETMLLLDFLTRDSWGTSLSGGRRWRHFAKRNAHVPPFLEARDRVRAFVRPVLSL